MELLLNKKSVLLERHEQGHTEMHCSMCTLLQRKSKVQAYPLQMREIPEHPFNKIAIDLVTEHKTSSSANTHTHPHHNRSPHRIARSIFHT